MSSESILVKGLTRRYGAVEALRGLSFQVRPGEIVGFLGPNGAGKTTTMKILTGVLAATSGEAKVAGLDLRSESEAVRRRVGYLPENVPLYEEMFVHDYLRFVAEMREVPREKRGERVLEVARRTGIAGMLGRTIGELSKGYRQRVGLAQAIIHEPEVLILDEPTTGLDPNQIVEIRDVIKSIGAEKTVIFSTHILQEVTAVCDRILLIAKGVLVAGGTVEELREVVALRCPDVPKEEIDLERIFRELTTDDAVADAEARQGGDVEAEEDVKEEAETSAEEVPGGEVKEEVGA